MKQFFIIALMLCAIFAVSCKEEKQETKAGNDKINIVASNFPLYDFARAAAKEKANIKMLTPPGSSLHSYEPTPADIKDIQNANVFLYIGGESDTWVARILSTLDTSNMKIVKLFDFVKLHEEEEKEGMQAEEEEEGEGEAYDEHIWTSPKNAVIMIRTITDALCSKDASNCDSYKESANAYISQIEAKANEIAQIVNASARKRIVVADRFPFLYLVKEYGLDYAAAFPGCSDQSDASVATIAYLIKTVKNDNIPYIYHVELSNKKTAETVAEQTGAKLLLLHSYHNVSKQEFENGTTYLDLLKQNTASLKTGLE